MTVILLNHPVLAISKIENIPVINSQSLEQQAQKLYEAGKFTAAIELLKNAISNYNKQGDIIGELIASRNLALVYQKIGKWQESKEIIDTCYQTIKKIPNNRENQQILAQLLEVKGQLELSMGNSQAALDSWIMATAIYKQLGQNREFIKNRINQAQALQALGLYSQAVKTLTETKSDLIKEPDTIIKAKSLLSLGDVQRGIGKFKESTKTLQESLAIARKISSNNSIAEALISLGKTARLQNELEIALNYFQVASKQPTSSDLLVQAQLNELEILLENKKFAQSQKLITKIQNSLTQLPPSRTSVYARITLGKILINSDIRNYYQSLIAHELATAIQLATKLADKRAESFGLGILGNLYEKNSRYPDARELTEKALLISQSNNAPDLSYQWQWQLGRILKNQKQEKSAIAAYSQSVKTLQSLRSDLVAISSDVQFSFRETVEPVYRELVDLLLQPGANQENLKAAREVIESLQLAELDNFFRNACLDAQPVKIDDLDPTSAIFYSIILPDRLEVIIGIPGEPLTRHTTKLPQAEIESNLQQMRATLASPRDRVFNRKRLRLSQQVYQWLIAPIEEELKNKSIKNLVFISDGVLRNIPFTTLYDGKQYLIEKYSVALAPSLQLIEPKALVRDNIQLLGGGVSQSRQGFPPLPNVIVELNSIQKKVPNSVFLKDKLFTGTQLENQVKSHPYQIVHFATHGEFSSNSENTFVLTWDEKLTVDQLNRLLRYHRKQRNPIELLVLSACRTAAGDNRATLGLAGMAVRSGARSTIASLWYVNDEATAQLMTNFYQELTNTKNIKAEALRRAQLSTLKDPKFAHPYYWSAFVLIGNWL